MFRLEKKIGWQDEWRNTPEQTRRIERRASLYLFILNVLILIPSAYRHKNKSYFITALAKSLIGSYVKYCWYIY